jgi:hypothetical protein
MIRSAHQRCQRHDECLHRWQGRSSNWRKGGISHEHVKLGRRVWIDNATQWPPIRSGIGRLDLDRSVLVSVLTVAIRSNPFVVLSVGSTIAARLLNSAPTKYTPAAPVSTGGILAIDSYLLRQSFGARSGRPQGLRLRSAPNSAATLTISRPRFATQISPALRFEWLRRVYTSHGDRRESSNVDSVLVGNPGRLRYTSTVSQSGLEVTLIS